MKTFVAARTRRSAGLTASVALALLLSACSDDGSDTGSASGSGSGSASGSGSGSGSGLGSEDLTGATDDAAILGAVDEYRRYV